MYSRLLRKHLPIRKTNNECQLVINAINNSNCFSVLSLYLLMPNPDLLPERSNRTMP